METVEILEKARELISDESRWTQASSARSADGRPCRIFSKDAARFCAIGALCRVMEIEEMSVTGQKATERLRSVLPSRFGGSITGLNDTTSHSEVMNLFDCAIAASRGVS